MIRLSHPTQIIQGTIQLPASKSVTNRMLILQALYEPTLKLTNVSSANDSQVLSKLLKQNNNHLNVEDAGTVYRFLTAYCAVTEGEFCITGSKRLMERPIDGLVDILRSMGADIERTTVENKPALKITGKKLKANDLVFDVSKVKSSQYISALLMIAPKIKGDFKLKISANMPSMPYIQMTMTCMRRLGFSVNLSHQLLSVAKTKRFDGEEFNIEPDWSGFYYWFSMALLSKEADLFFPGLHQNNIQRERNRLFDVGAESLFFDDNNEGLRLVKKGDSTPEIPHQLSYRDFPDLAPTFICLTAALSTSLNFLGLDSLPLKETDRIAALQSHLSKVGCSLTEKAESWKLDAENFELTEGTVFSTFKDHRMAMCVAPYALLNEIEIEDPDVVSKSYPEFWDHLTSVGFEIKKEKP